MDYSNIFLITNFGNGLYYDNNHTKNGRIEVCYRDFRENFFNGRGKNDV